MPTDTWQFEPLGCKGVGQKQTTLSWTQLASRRFYKVQALIHVASFITQSSKRDKNSFSKWQASTCRTPWNDSLSSASDTITFSQSLSLTILNECCCHLGFLFSFVFHSILQVRSVSGKKQETMSTTLTLFWCNTNRNQDDIPQDALHFLCFEILIWQ